MIILHIARLNNDSCAGVNVAVPQHILAQQKEEVVGLLNITNVQIDGIKNQFFYHSKIRIEELPKPFDNPDIVVFHEVYYPAFLAIHGDLKRKGIPYVIIPHGCLTKHAQKKKFLKKKIGNLLLFDKFIFDSLAVQFLSENERDNSNFRVNKFIGTNGICIPQNVEKKIENNKIKIIYIGALLVHIKGIDLMLNAIKMQKELFDRKNVEVSLYGPNSGNSHKKISKMISDMKLEGIVKLCDAVYGDVKKDILTSADIFIQTSRTEGMSMGLLEALGYGIPCLVTAGTNLDNKIEKYNAGWGCKTEAKAIAEAFERMFNDWAEWETKAVNAKNMIEKEFSWEIVCKQTINKYKELCNVNEAEKCF